MLDAIATQRYKLLQGAFYRDKCMSVAGKSMW